MKRLILIAVLSLGMIGCTENQNAKEYGGTMTINIPANKKLVNATWKEADLWYLVRERKAGETPERFEFKEDSTYGVWNGTVIFQEQ